MKYIDADRLKDEIERKIAQYSDWAEEEWEDDREYNHGAFGAFKNVRLIIDSLQQEQPMPDSTQLIAEWEKEKAMLEQKDFRGDAERMAYNAFLDGFVKGLGYEGTK